MKRKKVLVTGGAGFIGSHLVDRLANEGCRVVVLDDLSTGSLENIRGHLDSGKVQLIQGDVRDYKIVEEAVKDVDFVCHLAAIISVPFSMQEPLLTHEVNTTGTLNLLIAARKHEVDRFVNVSTCAVYGDPEVLPVNEMYPANPISPYAASKLAAEHYCLAFRQAYGLKTVTLRPFNVYGSRQNDGVVAQFVKRLKKGWRPIIYGDGGQTRDFVYVKDVVDAMVLALEHDGVAGEIFNIGTGEATTINELAELLFQIFGKDLEPKREEPRTGDVKKSCADISKAERELGYKPRFSLEKALRDFVEYEAK